LDIPSHPSSLPETRCYPRISVPTAVHAINSQAFSSGTVLRLRVYWAIAALATSKAIPEFLGGKEEYVSRTRESTKWPIIARHIIAKTQTWSRGRLNTDCLLQCQDVSHCSGSRKVLMLLWGIVLVKMSIYSY